MDIKEYTAGMQDIARRKNQWAEAVRVQGLGGQDMANWYNTFVITLFEDMTQDLGPVAHCIKVIKTRFFSVAWPGSRVTATLTAPQLCPKIVFLPGGDPLIDVWRGLEIEAARLKAKLTCVRVQQAIHVELDSK